MSNKNIMLIGFMGAGKSTVSRELALITGRIEIDIDQYIVEKEGMAISDIFERYGEAYFRDLETKALREIEKEDNLIISCGGGIVVKEENVSIMKNKGIIVLLTATPETVFERVKNSKERPILNNNMNIDFIKELMEKRAELYKNVADLIISTDNKDVKNICNEIILAIEEN